MLTPIRSLVQMRLPSRVSRLSLARALLSLLEVHLGFTDACNVILQHLHIHNLVHDFEILFGGRIGFDEKNVQAFAI